MANMVKCDICGSRFDLDAGGSYNRKTMRFICPACVAETAAQKKERSRPQLNGRTIAKLIFGGIFLAYAFDELSSDMGSFLFGLAIGLPLILWALFPWIRYLLDKKASTDLENNIYESKIQIRREQERKPKVCPGCGATSYGDVCDYCGSKLP